MSSSKQVLVFIASHSLVYSSFRRCVQLSSLLSAGLWRYLLSRSKITKCSMRYGYIHMSFRIVHEFSKSHHTTCLHHIMLLMSYYIRESWCYMQFLTLWIPINDNLLDASLSTYTETYYLLVDSYMCYLFFLSLFQCHCCFLFIFK